MLSSNGILVTELINRAQGELLARYPETVLFGLGVNDPKRIFGTTVNLVEQFGKSRVFETPTAESCSLGVAVGLAITDYKPIVVYQRLDFFLLAMDQLVNSAAKWRYMFGDSYSTSMIIRLIVGRGWGQGPTHSQNLHSLFTHIPNLRVVFPAFADDFISQYRNAFENPYPLIMIEDRWVHQSRQSLTDNISIPSLTQVRNVHLGDAITLITFGFMSILSQKVTAFFAEKGVFVDHLSLISLKPIDFNPLYESAKKTRRVIILDSGFEVASLASYISHKISGACFSFLRQPVKVLTAGDFAEPTSHGVIAHVKTNAKDIAFCVAQELGISPYEDWEDLDESPVDVPNSKFQGPF